MENLDLKAENILFDLIEQCDHELALKLLRGNNHISEDELNKSLISACRHGYKFIVQTLVRLGANVSYRDTHGNTPLLVSVDNGFTDIVHFLLTHKADVNASNSVGDSALILSVRSSGSTEITEYLLKQRGINIDHQNHDGYTAIMKAAEVKNVDTLNILLDEYCKMPSELFFNISGEHRTHTKDSNMFHICEWKKLDEPMNCNGENVQEIAERSGLGSIFQLLRKHKSTGISPLELAMESDDMKSFHILLDCNFVYGSDITKSVDDIFIKIFQISNDRDSVHFKENEITMINALLKCGTDVDTSWFDHIPLAARAEVDRCRLDSHFSRPASLQHPVYCKRQVAPIQIAAKSGCYEVIELLLSFKADVNRYDFPSSPLHIALSHGHIECAKLLIQHGAKIEFKQALELAVDQQEVKYVRFLVENYKREIMKHFKRASTIQAILLRSVRKRNLEIIGHILDIGANINGAKNSEVSPLAESKNGEVAKFLIARGADVNHVTSINKRSHTPLIKVLIGRGSSVNSVVEVIQVLLENGASVNDRNWEGKTPLMLAAAKDGSMSVLQLLLDHGFEIGDRDFKGNTALICAVLESCSHNVSLLLQFTTDRKGLLNVQNNEGLTALMYAVIFENAFITKKLIDQGADVNIKDTNGNTALFHLLITSDKHEDEILRSLIQAGSDVNCQNNEGLSPLMLTAKSCLKDTMCLLIDSGAEINAVSKKDATKTALTHLLHRAHLTSEHFNCSEYLLDRGASSSYVEAAIFHEILVAGQIQVVPKLIRCGLGPSSTTPHSMLSFSNVEHKISFSPLCTALCVGNSELARFFVGNLFLTNSDVSLLGCNKLIRQHIKRQNFKESLEILNEISTQPMTLFNLSFVAVSTAVGATPGREIRVNKLPLPQIIKDRLLFKSQDVALTVPEKNVTIERLRMFGNLNENFENLVRILMHRGVNYTLTNHEAFFYALGYIHHYGRQYNFSDSD